MARPIVMAIYKIECTSNGKLYVGSTVNLRRRWIRHVSHADANKHHCAPLQAAWSKYGRDAFTFHVLEYITDKDAILNWEQFWLDELSPTFNVLKSAGNMTGMVHSAATRQRIADGNRGKYVSPETRHRISEVHQGKTISQSHREALRIAHTGRAPSALAVARLIESRTGKPLSLETKQKIREKAVARAAARKLANTLSNVV